MNQKIRLEFQLVKLTVICIAIQTTVILSKSGRVLRKINGLLEQLVGLLKIEFNEGRMMKTIYKVLYPIGYEKNTRWKIIFQRHYRLFQVPPILFERRKMETDEAFEEDNSRNSLISLKISGKKLLRKIIRKNWNYYKIYL